MTFLIMFDRRFARSMALPQPASSFQIRCRFYCLKLNPLNPLFQFGLLSLPNYSAAAILLLANEASEEQVTTTCFCLRSLSLEYVMHHLLPDWVRESYSQRDKMYKRLKSLYLTSSGISCYFDSTPLPPHSSR